MDKNVTGDLDLSNPVEKIELKGKNFNKIWKKIENYLISNEKDIKERRAKNRETGGSNDLNDLKSHLFNIINSAEIKEKLRDNLAAFKDITQSLSSLKIDNLEYCVKVWELLNQQN